MRFLKGDPWIWAILIVMLLFSVLVVYSATASLAYVKSEGDTSSFLVKQCFTVGMCFVTMVIVHYISLKLLLKFAKGIFLASLIIIMIVYLRDFTLNESKRWFVVPIIGLTIQPADFVELATILLLGSRLSKITDIGHISLLPPLSPAKWRANPQLSQHIFHNTTTPLLVPVGVACALIFWSGLSSAMILYFCCLMMLIIAGVRAKEVWRFLRVTVLVGIAAVMVMLIFGAGRSETWINRSVRFVTTSIGMESALVEGVDTEDFQIEQAKIAIASGGLWGKGPGNSTQRSQLPHSYSDFAYAFIAEEYGVIGPILIILCYLTILIRARKVALNRHTPRSHMLVVHGLVLALTLTAFLHIFVSLGIAPVTGQVLPFVGQGGSSMFFSSIAMGMVLSVSRGANKAAFREYRKELAKEKQLEMEQLALQKQQGSQQEELEGTLPNESDNEEIDQMGDDTENSNNQDKDEDNN